MESSIVGNAHASVQETITPVNSPTAFENNDHLREISTQAQLMAPPVVEDHSLGHGLSVAAESFIFVEYKNR